jgi:hypothetical protein
VGVMDGTYLYIEKQKCSASQKRRELFLMIGINSDLFNLKIIAFPGFIGDL